MKVLFAHAILATAIAIPAVSWAQPVTRSDVESSVTQAEQNGTLHQSKVHYPDATRSAQARSSNDYGSSPLVNSQSGHRGSTETPMDKALFSHH
ncbi:DUF4148 domain-containing protein [Paraburkholderia sp. UYCP14C]|uniref:DUF4148 domain-containing protein n=1 Tax=Paraburkholderia sp. UYCP14C TaxID=2511130 RepID=UPI00101EAC66|nr:DUF4148 domain-containing protein [Paraburkholderia sp. UYCP14C]RZF31736.1 DUF4148 domain-containing protein [Paraburkholderia sp. UYCP14C]